jgi:uncharacterized membrane protein YdfJ with MMPL/SSD domain
MLVLVAGMILFVGLTAGVTAFKIGGFTSSPPSGTDSAAGASAIAAHFPVANSNPETLLLIFSSSIWEHPDSLSLAQTSLSNAPSLRAVSGPLNPNGSSLTAAELASLHAQLGPAGALPPTPAPASPVPTQQYQAYRATAQFMSADGLTVQFYALLPAGASGTQAAINSIPSVRTTLAAVARATSEHGTVACPVLIQSPSTSDKRRPTTS